MEIREFTAANKQKMLQDLSELIAIPSVFNEKEAGEGKPFGREVAKCLELMLQKAERMGMSVRNVAGYAGEITVGDGDLMIGVLGHVDVVVAGEGWDTEAFVPEIKDGKIYGRGSSDDKGPLVASLYALKYLMDEKRIPAHASLRIIIGTNEEESWEGIKYYKQHTQRLPDYSIVPDGYFPLVSCEKGYLDFDLKLPVRKIPKEDILVTELSGGTGACIVPGKASCTLICTKIEPALIAERLNLSDGITARVSDNQVLVTAEGRSTHAMSPEKGKNAISLLFAALGALECVTSLDSAVEAYNTLIGMDYNGERFNCAFEDKLSGKLTMNIGTVHLEENQNDGALYCVLEVNLRYPASMQKQEILLAIDQTCRASRVTWIEREWITPVYVKPDSLFVQTLMNAYQFVSGDSTHGPFSIGGATYARAIPNAVAFGPLFPYEEELAHEPNEYLSIESLKKMTEIYIHALEALLHMEDNTGR